MEATRAMMWMVQLRTSGGSLVPFAAAKPMMKRVAVPSAGTCIKEVEEGCVDDELETKSQRGLVRG